MFDRLFHEVVNLLNGFLRVGLSDGCSERWTHVSHRLRLSEPMVRPVCLTPHGIHHRFLGLGG